MINFESEELNLAVKVKKKIWETRVPSCGEICKLYLRYFVPIMKMNLKIKVFMKVGTDDEIDKKRCSYFFRPFPIKTFLWGQN